MLFFLASGLLMIGCDTTVNEEGDGEIDATTTTTIENPPPSEFDATGIINGRVIDRATQAPIEGATVSLFDTLSATTGADGSFSIGNVPVNASDDAGSAVTTDYNVHVTTPEGSAYRDYFTAEVTLAYGSDEGGSGSANNLAANVTFPLAKTSGSVKGRAHITSQVDGTEMPLNGADVSLVQSLPVQFDDDGNALRFATIRTDTVQTSESGNFTFENVEIGSSFDVEVLVGNSGEMVNNFVTGGNLALENGATANLGDLDVTSDIPDFKVTDVSPAPETDVGTATPSITFTFNRPIVDNSFVQEGENDVGTNGSFNGEKFPDEVALVPDTRKSTKAMNPDNIHPVEVTLNSDRTELTVTPTEDLEDGLIYAFSAEPSGFGISGFGFGDSRFTDKYGVPVSNAAKGTFTFSVGVDNSQPAVPSPSFVDGPPQVDYTDGSVTAEFEIDVDNSGAEVKGYEVYARTEDEREDRNGAADQFFKVTSITPSASAFDQNFGIVPANEAEFGTLEFEAEVSGTPVASDGGSYGPVEWKVRAVSINNVRGDFSNVIETGDNVSPRVENASMTDDDGDGDHDFITVEFSEALDVSTASDVSNYTLTDGNNTRDILNSVDEVNNVTADDHSTFNRTEVVITLDDGNSINAGDEIQVDSAVLDLSTNNGVDSDNNTNTF